MEVLNSIIKFITEDYWMYIADMSVVTSEKVVAGIVGFTLFIIIAFFGIIGSTIHYGGDMIRHYKNIAKPTIKKLRLNMLKFEFRYLYLPYLTSPVESITEEYHHIIGGIKPGMTLDPKVYNSIMREHNRTLMNVLSTSSIGVLEPYMEEPIYTGFGVKKNLEGTYSFYTFKGGEPRDKIDVSAEYLKKFAKKKAFAAMNFGCCKVPVIVVTEYGGSKAGDNIIKDNHDMNVYENIYNNICICMSRWIPVIGICVHPPRDEGGFICKTEDDDWYRSRVYANFIVNKKVLVIRDDDYLMPKEDMEKFFDHFHTRENLMDMIGSDYALDLKARDEKKTFALTYKNVTLFPIDLETMNAIADKSMKDGNGPVDILYYSSTEAALKIISANENIKTGNIVFVWEDGKQMMYNVIRDNFENPPMTFKKIERHVFNNLVLSNEDLNVFRYPTMADFVHDACHGVIKVNVGVDLLVVELKDLPDEYYLIDK